MTEENKEVTEGRKKLTIVDADSLFYIIGYRFKDMLDGNQMTKLSATTSLGSMFEDILAATGADYYLAFMGDGQTKCFRYDVSPDYKANRKEKEEWQNYWIPIFRKYLNEEHKVTMCGKIEADDALPICGNHYKDEYDIVYAYIDKDLECMEPHMRYNYKTKEFIDVDETMSARRLCRLLMEGDSTDNIKGIPGVGAVKAKEHAMSVDNKLAALELCEQVYMANLLVTIPEKKYNSALKKHIAAYKEMNCIARISAAKKKELTAEFEKTKDQFYEYTDETWRNYYKTQLALVSLLQEPAFGFEIPEVIEVPERIKAQGQTAALDGFHANEERPDEYNILDI